MKALFIFPPFYSQFSISCGIPQILSYLKTKNHNVKAIDLNMKFFNYLYNEKVLNNLLLEAYEIYKNHNNYNLPSKYYNFLETFFSNKKLVYKIHKTIKNIDDIKQGLKSQKNFNNLRIQQFLLKEVKYIQILINLIFMEESLYKDKEYYINDSKISTYKNFLNLIINDILKENYDYIGFSTSGDTQFLSSLIASKLLKEKGYTVYATTLDNAQSIYDVEYASKKVIVIGNEANGVKNNILKFADKNIYIPMLNNTESLNAGVAASIIMCDVQRKI